MATKLKEILNLKGTVALFLSAVMILQTGGDILSRGISVFAATATSDKSIILPEGESDGTIKAEGGSYMVKRGDVVLKNGDAVYAGDELTVTYMPDEGYVLLPDRESTETQKTITITDEDFYDDATSKISADGWTALSDSVNYQSVRTSGYKINIPKTDMNVKTAEYVSKLNGEVTLSFEWAINQWNAAAYGNFTMKLYINNEAVKIVTFDSSNVNPVANILSEEYTFDGSGNDTIKWEFQRTESGSFTDSLGRYAYLGNIVLQTNNYKPEILTFEKSNSIIIGEAKNGTISADKQTACSGDAVTVTVTPDRYYGITSVTAKDGNGNNVTLTAGGNGEYTFTMPNSDVTVTAECQYINNIFLADADADGRITAEGGSYTVKRGDEILKNGDLVYVGDNLTFTYTPDVGYILLPYGEITETQKTITVTDEDFYYDATSKISADGWTALSDDVDYEGVRTSGYKINIPRTDTTVKTAEYVSNLIGEVSLSFDWAINQEIYQYGYFTMKLYINNEEVKTVTFNNTNVNSSSNILSEEYKFNGSGNDTVKWEFQKTFYYNTVDPDGRYAYLGNIVLQTNTYKPEILTFAEGYAINIGEGENGTVTSDKIAASTGAAVTLMAVPDEGCLLKSVTVKDSEGSEIEVSRVDKQTMTFVMPSDEVTVSASFEKFGATTIDGALYYEIGTAEELCAFASYVNSGYYNDINGILTADIDMSEVIDFVPIGNETDFTNNTTAVPSGFKGIFDGNGYSVKNLTLDGAANYVYAGLFGVVSGTVRNLAMDSYSFVKTDNTDGRFGAMCGLVVTGGIIENCYVINSNVNATTSRVAGIIAGGNFGGTIRNCYSLNCSVIGTRSGYIAGDNQNDGSGSNQLTGSIENCYTDGNSLMASAKAGVVTGGEINVASDRFASGEITWLLSGKTDNSVWVQTLGEDVAPLLKSGSDSMSVAQITADGKQVYANVVKDGIEVKTEGSTLLAIVIDTAVYGGEDAYYLDSVGVVIDGTLYKTSYYYYDESNDRYAVFPVAREETSDKTATTVRGEATAQINEVLRHFVTASVGNLTINPSSKAK